MNPDRRGWFPAFLEWRDAAPVVSWCYLGDRPFDEPFYDGTLNGPMNTPFNRLFVHTTQMDVLEEWHRESPGLEPSGFIFHMSRCGSTLVSRMLAALPEHLVVSEAGPLDAIARAGRQVPHVPLETRAQWFRCMISALGQRRCGGEQRYFIKFDSQTILDFDVIRHAYPATPWIFVYRDPVEVLASHMNQPSSAMMPGVIGGGGLDLPAAQAFALADGEYGCRVLARLCQAACQALPNGGLPVNYTELPEAVCGNIATHFGIEFDGPAREAMQKATQFHAKLPNRRFRPDSEHKKAALSPEAHKSVQRWLRPWYEKLTQHSRPFLDNPARPI
jgi:hypothetical protein